MTRRRLLLLAILAASTLVAPSARAGGDNKLLNPSFERSALEPAPQLEGELPQPILPTGWIFEGMAGLFDHYPSGSGGRTVVSGSRAIAISAPASTADRYCLEQTGCIDSPVAPARNALRPIYSLTPHWRTAQPVTVTAGTKYTLSVFTAWEVVTVGQGATTRVRWLDGLGRTISETAGPKLLATDITSVGLTWQQISKANLVAPAGAVAAHVMLGHTDDLWIAQVRFDDVYFGTT